MRHNPARSQGDFAHAVGSFESRQRGQNRGWAHPCGKARVAILPTLQALNLGLGWPLGAAVSQRHQSIGTASAKAHSYSAFMRSNSTTLVAPVIGTITPGDFTVILLPSTRIRYTRSVSKIA